MLVCVGQFRDDRHEPLSVEARYIGSITSGTVNVEPHPRRPMNKRLGRGKSGSRRRSNRYRRGKAIAPLCITASDHEVYDFGHCPSTPESKFFQNIVPIARLFVLSKASATLTLASLAPF
jgi:hypothetical protein